MNNNVEAHHVGSYMNPLIICGAGIICSFLALATYHFILCKLCLRTHHPQLQLHQIADTSPTHSIDIPCGVDPEILNKIPILSFSPQKRDVFGLHQSECAICLGELERGEKLRLLPSCSHAFHIPCIDLWLSKHSNCPFCRAPIAIASPPSFSLPSRNVDDHEFEVLSRHVVPPLQDSSASSDHSSASSSRSHAPRPLLQHSLSVAYASRERPEALVMGLKRSLSMDQSCGVAISIQIDQEKPSTSSSSSPSSSSAADAWARNEVIQGKAISLRQLDHVSTMLMTSLTQLRNTRNEASRAILPD